MYSNKSRVRVFFQRERNLTAANQCNFFFFPGFFFFSFLLVNEVRRDAETGLESSHSSNNKFAPRSGGQLASWLSHQQGEEGGDQAFSFPSAFPRSKATMMDMKEKI